MPFISFDGTATLKEGPTCLFPNSLWNRTWTGQLKLFNGAHSGADSYTRYIILLPASHALQLRGGVGTVGFESSLSSPSQTPSLYFPVIATMPFKSRRSPRTAPLLPKNHEAFIGESGFDGASFSGAVFNLSTTIVGAGIMALPATLKQLGMIPGLLVIVLAGMLTQSSIDILLRFSRASKAGSYSGLVGDAFGGAGRTLLQVCIVINNVGMLVVYMIIIGTQKPLLFEAPNTHISSFGFGLIALALTDNKYVHSLF